MYIALMCVDAVISAYLLHMIAIQGNRLELAVSENTLIL